MGYDLIAYFDVDQDEIEQFVQNNKIDREDDEQLTEKVVGYYIDKYDLPIHFNGRKYNTTVPFKVYCDYNDNSNKYNVYTSYRVGFARNNVIFYDDEYKKILENKFGKKIPYSFDPVWIYSKKQALETIECLEIFYKDEEYVEYYLEWLKFASKYCNEWELSY